MTLEFLKNNTDISAPRKIVAWTLGIMLVALVAGYVYYIKTAIYNIAEASQLESDSAELSGRLSELEYKYISLKNGITEARARELGFEPVVYPQYVKKPRPQSLLSLDQRNTTR